MNTLALKKTLITTIIFMKNQNKEDLKIKDINKDEVLEDLLRFLVFIEEIEQREKDKSINYDYRNNLLQIKKYLVTLKSML